MWGTVGCSKGHSRLDALRHWEAVSRGDENDAVQSMGATANAAPDQPISVQAGSRSSCNTCLHLLPMVSGVPPPPVSLSHLSALLMTGVLHTAVFANHLVAWQSVLHSVPSNTGTPDIWWPRSPQEEVTPNTELSGTLQPALSATAPPSSLFRS